MEENKGNKEDQFTQPFESLIQCAHTTGIPFSHLKAAKKLKAPGFRGSRIDFILFHPWYETNKDLLNEQVADSWDAIRTENARKDGVIKDLTIEELRHQLLNKAEVLKFLRAISSAMTALLDARDDDLAPRLADKSIDQIKTELAKNREELYAVVNEQAITDWIATQKEKKKK